MPRHAIAAGTPVTTSAAGASPAVSTARSLVVASPDAEVAVALRACVDRAFVTVHDTEPDHAAGVIDACRPWPWMVVGCAEQAPPALLASLRHRPILVFWLGRVPHGLPAHARRFERFSELTVAVTSAIAAEVAGMRLAIGSGVLLPGGEVRRNAELEALISNHPHGFVLPRARFRAAATALRRAAPGCRVAQTSGGMALRAAETQR